MKHDENWLNVGWMSDFQSSGTIYAFFEFGKSELLMFGCKLWCLPSSEQKSLLQATNTWEQKAGSTKQSFQKPGKWENR